MGMCGVCVRVCAGFHRCTLLFMGVLRCVRMFIGMCVWVWVGVREWLRVWAGVYGFSQMSDVRGFTLLCAGMRGCAQMCEDVHQCGCARVCVDVHFNMY